jgi:chemotaxis protein methyltransferase CheR
MMVGGPVATAGKRQYTFPASITEQTFALFQALIRQEAGIHLAPTKKSLVVGRLSRRLRDLGVGSFQEYYQLVANGGDTEERIRMLDCICTNETSFFRDRRPFDFLEDSVFPTWAAQADKRQREKRIRVWSSGCSTGEEPYSLAMLLLDHFPPSSGWKLDVLATDLSTRALERAAAGISPIEKAKGIPEAYLKRFMMRGRGSQTGNMKVRDEVREIVRFERINLNAKNYPVSGFFDSIFFRNVMIYFDMETKKEVVDRVVRHLKPSGHIVVGLAETLNGFSSRITRVMPGVYTTVGR